MGFNGIYCGLMGLYSDLMDYEWDIPSGKLTVCYWKLPFIVDLPIKNGGSFHSYVKLAEATELQKLLLCFAG